MTAKNVYFDSSGMSLRLTDEEAVLFEAEIETVQRKWALIEYQRRGIWAGNQGKYVKTKAELNEWDPLPKYLEDVL